MPLYVPARFESLHTNYRASAYLSANQNHASSGSFVAIAYNTEDYDPNNNYVSNVYTVPVAGYYDIVAEGEIQLNTGDTAGKRIICSIYKNGAEVKRGTDHGVEAALAGNTLISYAVMAHRILLAAGDTIDIRLYQDSSGTRVIQGGAALNYMMIGLVEAL